MVPAALPVPESRPSDRPRPYCPCRCVRSRSVRSIIVTPGEWRKRRRAGRRRIRSGDLAIDQIWALHRSKNWYYVHSSSKVAAMRTILLSSAAIVAAVAISAAAASDTAQAASRFDGSWTVQITTRRGACDPSSSFGVEIHDGVVSGAASGRVSKNGAVSVSVSSGGSYASGSGRLSTGSGGGSWHGVGSRGACSGTWVAGRR
jgi:hypothetical protein